MSLTGRRQMLLLLSLAVFLARPAFAIDRAGLDGQIAQMDQLWAERAEPGRVMKMVELGQQILASDPRSYESSWRVARAYWFEGHTAQDKRRGRDAAAAGMRYAQQAIDLNPGGVEGHFMYALSVANYATTITPVEAVVEGVAAKFEKAALDAYALDRGFDHGAPIIALGRFYFELPWPMRDLHRSRRYLEEARRLYPESLYGRVYLAETYYALGEEEAAKQELELSLAVASGSGDPPEVKEARELARCALERLFSEATQLACARAK